MSESKDIEVATKASHSQTGTYVVLQETNESEMETWLYFIKYEGNEKNLEHLKSKIESVENIVIPDCSVFDIDLEHRVSAQTAKEMTKVELNSQQWHRKFDGKLSKVKIKFSDKDDDEDKVLKIFNKLGYGQIENYIDDEDIDTCDEASEVSDDDSDDNDDSDDDSDDDDDALDEKGEKDSDDEDDS
jgi:hypothetical protein